MRINYTKVYQKVKRSDKLTKFIGSFGARPISQCDIIMIKIAEEKYFEMKIKQAKTKIFSEMYKL